MRSHILGKIDLDPEKLAPDLEAIATAPRIHEEYDEYSSGLWMNISLWNSSGDKADTTYRDIEGTALPTDYARALPYIDSVVRRTFDTANVKMLRVRNLVDAIVVPHRDFVELDKDLDRYFRVLFALEDNPQGLHSENDAVLRMRAGEVWYLDASAAHSAVNFSANHRRAVCIDFAFEGEFKESDIFLDENAYDPTIEPELPARKKFTTENYENLLKLGRIIDQENFRDILFLLSKIHFRYAVHAGEAYQWLLDITKESGDAVLVGKAEQLQNYMVGDRKLGERFSLTDWN